MEAAAFRRGILGQEKERSPEAAFRAFTGEEFQEIPANSGATEGRSRGFWTAFLA